MSQPEFKARGSGFKLARFGFPDLPAWEADTLLIQPPRHERRIYYDRGERGEGKTGRYVREGERGDAKRWTYI